MFNVLSGLQEGSHSVTIVSRDVNSGQGPFVKGQVVKSFGGKLSAAASTDAKIAEFVFEDLTGQASGKLTTIFGSFEAETDQMDTVYNGAPAADDYLVANGGKLAKAKAGDITAGTELAYCISVASGVYRFRTLN